MSIFGKKTNPIGIDFGRSSIKMIQKKGSDSVYTTDKMDVPAEVAANPQAYSEWASKAIKEMIARSGFKGRIVRSSLPVNQVTGCHLRIDKMEQSQMDKVVKAEAAALLPFPLDNAMMKYTIAGETFDSSDSSYKLEIIVHAVSAKNIYYHLKCLESCKLEAESVSVPASILPNAYKSGKNHSAARTLYIDLGSKSAQAVISGDDGILFCREIQSPYSSNNKGFDQNLMLDEIRACIRYHDMIWDQNPVKEMIFSGGYCSNEHLVDDLAKRIGIEGHVGHLPIDIADSSVSDCQYAIAYGVTV